MSRASRPVTAMLPLACLLAFGPAVRGVAADLTSASYRLRGIHPSGIGPARLQNPLPSPQSGGSGISLGQGDALGPFGSPTTLTTLLPGIWPIAARALPALDLDQDQRPWFLDEDDDGDGLLDVVETGTGVFVSVSNTGTSPVDPDSDHDGHSDGAEVASGTDPNDPGSPGPPPPSVPGLSWLGRALLALALIGPNRRLAGERRQHV